ncbi:hypothetical protein [Nocardioides perillae]|uniref:Uncharacterized protein n=1 Tax=Nocardioides perillae TaxID=1119534 RepID=A0A7Y9RSM0_9ACTN|nr:hypothetical protein [Nocardioides perillae]NYG53903.1 hypothetical protein [Nocardioides perillae]
MRRAAVVVALVVLAVAAWAGSGWWAESRATAYARQAAADHRDVYRDARVDVTTLDGARAAVASGEVDQVDAWWALREDYPAEVGVSVRTDEEGWLLGCATVLAGVVAWRLEQPTRCVRVVGGDDDVVEPDPAGYSATVLQGG